MLVFAVSLSGFAVSLYLGSRCHCVIVTSVALLGLAVSLCLGKQATECNGF